MVLHFVFIFCLGFNAYSADPVTVVVSLRAPYSPFLNEYGSSGIDQLQVSIIVNDSRMQNYPAKLQMFVEHIGTGIIMRTAEYAPIPPILLSGSTIEVFNGFDLNKYFLAQNNVFMGFDQSQYVQTGRIPDGQYRMGFRVVDSRRTNVVLSNTAYTQPAWFLLNDPPQINLPRNKEELRVNEFQNVKLEWFARHLGSMNASFTTSYQIELFAMRLPGINPNQIAMSMQPNFTDVTNQTTYFLTNDKYVLEPGVEYAFRIKAMSGINEFTLFQNDGYSEVYSFVYGSLCPQPSDVSAQPSDTEKVEITWGSDPSHSSYEVRFRKAGQVNDSWNTRESLFETAEIANVLSSGVKYEYQVKANCLTVESDYSTLNYFTIPYISQDTDFECGAEDDFQIENTTPKPSLEVGETINYVKFPIKLTEVSGGNGVFKGKGQMRVPFLRHIKVNMEFDNIKVNELNEVYEGELVSIYNPDSKFLIGDITDYFAEGDQIGNIIDGVDSAAITLDFPVENASNLAVIVSGNSVTVSSGGQSVSTTIENSEEGTTIQDSEGNLYAVDSKGNVTKVGKTIPSGETQNSETTNFSPTDFDNEIELSFQNAGKWAFDAFDEVYLGSKFADEFETVGGRITPWKFVPIGKSDKVTASLTKGRIDLSKIKFKTPTGTEFFAEEKNGRLEITLIGAKQRDGYELFAVYEENDTTTRTIGKLNIASYPLIDRNLTLVPMQSGSVSASSIETAINSIYKPYGVSWSVKIDDIFEDRSWDKDNNGLKGTGTEFYSAFTDEMRALNANYTAQRGVDDKSVYLFWFVENADGAENMLGDMPLDSRFGYVFSPTITDKTHLTIAHELGHGVFQLHHTFSSKYGIEKKTNNLMDYAGGRELTKYQWDVLFDAQTMVAKWAKSEEESALISKIYESNQLVLDYIELIRDANLKGKKSVDVGFLWPGDNYLTISGKNVKLPNGKEINIAISKSSYTDEVQPLYSDVGVKFSYQLESSLHVVQSILAYFFPDFSVTEEGKKRLKVFQFFDNDGSKSYLSVSVDEMDANNLGYYMFGDQWKQDFVKSDKSWVLHLYSPGISDKFEEAAFDDDILECRRLSYYALTHRFSDKHDFSPNSTGIYGNVFENNYAAKLKRNITGQEGVSVYLFDIENGMITMDETSIDFGSNEGNQQGQIRDKYYPVDVKLYDGDDQPALGNDFYGNNDFVSGRTLDISDALGPLVFEGGGIIQGYMRGFGFTQFQYRIDIGGQISTELFNLSAGVGIIEGGYQLNKGLANPTNFQGPGISTIVSASDFRNPISLSFTNWEGVEEESGITIWKGTAASLSLTLAKYSTAWDNIKPGNVSYIKAKTKCIFPELSPTTDKILNDYYNK